MRVYSAFDGMSCGQVALERENIPIKTYLSSEIDKYAMSVAQYNYPHTVQMGDINNINPNSIKDIDLMIGGSPCQDVSFSGKGKGLVEGERSNLFFKWAEHLDIIKPRYFLLENVRMKQEYQDIISKLLGVSPIMLPSHLDSGQHRNRWYWTNIPFDMEKDYPTDKNIYLKDVLECECCSTDRSKSHCLDANYWKGGNLKSYFVKNRRQLVFNQHGCQQVGVADINGHDVIKRVYSKEGKAPTLNSMNGGNREPKVLCGAIRGRYNDDGTIRQQLELKYDGKSNSLTTVQKDNVVVDPKDMTWRKLTVKECERLQTLDDDYTLYGQNHLGDTFRVSNTQRYRMIGNGWCVDSVRNIFKALGKVL